MKSVFIIILLSLVVTSFSSCYNTKIAVGDTNVNGPLYKVNSEWNHHLIGGLVPLGNAKMKGGDYVGNRTDYVVKTNTSFLNGLVAFFTLSIYTPTTTTYYLPIPEAGLFSGENKYEEKKLYTDPSTASKKVTTPREEFVDTPEEVVTHIIHFRNGSSIRGEVVEKLEDITTIRTLSGKVVRYRNSDISRIVKDNE